MSGPLWIAVAALLWATDALVRFPTIATIPPLVLVFLEHTIAILLFVPWIFLRSKKSFFKFSSRQWLGLFVIGAGASAIATVFFTLSFQSINPSVTILFQKLQSIFVVIIASVFLGERPKRNFYFWAPIAFLSAVFLGFPTTSFSIPLISLGVTYALIAALIWAVCTVIGKAVLKSIPFEITSAWRFIFGWITLLTILLFKTPIHQIIPYSVTEPHLALGIIYLAIFPGFVAMLSYYRGLSKTQVSVATFVELIFPVAAICLNAIFLKLPLNKIQLIAGSVLIFSIVRISAQDSFK